MDTAPAKFDWIGWLASIPGIPAGWGADPASSLPVPMATIAESLPLWRSGRADNGPPTRIAA